MTQLLLRAAARFRALTAGVLLLLAALPVHAQSGAPVLLVVGDSISAAYGLPADAGWVHLLASQLDAEHYAYRVVNASITGDTTAGGRARLPGLLRQYHPGIVVIELGGNDGLRGGSLDAMRKNLDVMVSDAQRGGAKVLLIGMRVPPNYGATYTHAFAAVFAEVAKARKVPLVPFFFDGFGATEASFQPDRIHPTSAAQPRLLQNVWPTLQPLLAKPRP